MICTKLSDTFKQIKAYSKSICNRNFQFSIFNFQFISAVLLLILSSCSGGGDEVSIEGRLLHMNQATFYVYSTDGTIDGIDTITVHGGRFEYDREISREGTLIMVFPNYSQLPVFVEPGAGISIKGDAARLREVEVKGTKANEDFTLFRTEHLDATPTEMKRITADAVQSGQYADEILLWLIRSQYLSYTDTDVKGAVNLLHSMTKKSPDNVKVKRLFNQLSAMGTLTVGDRIEHFEATDIDGNKCSEKMLQEGVTVVMTCASWSYDSQNMLRRLAARQRNGEPLTIMKKNKAEAKPVARVMAICLDADKKAAKDMRGRCDASGVTMLSDESQWANPLIKTFALTTIPDNVVIDGGKVVLRGVPTGDL